ncbi:MAG: histidine triad nucleotide-binding protein [Verrucomicrobiota bacterium JB023]|nr:histidine triad nucleotide-binding protein [Verrucomicrobiota bacterium JB023]
MAEKSLFEKICDREIPAEIIYEDELCLCFKDISPQAPTHLLVIPKERINRLAEATSDHQNLLGHLFATVPHIARQEGFLESGFRCVINSGPDGGETVPHLHIHLLAGRKLEWPPG